MTVTEMRWGSPEISITCADQIASLQAQFSGTLAIIFLFTALFVILYIIELRARKSAQRCMNDFANSVQVGREGLAESSAADSFRPWNEKQRSDAAAHKREALRRSRLVRSAGEMIADLWEIPLQEAKSHVSSVIDDVPDDAWMDEDRFCAAVRKALDGREEGRV